MQVRNWVALNASAIVGIVRANAHAIAKLGFTRVMRTILAGITRAHTIARAKLGGTRRVICTMLHSRHPTRARLELRVQNWVPHVV